MAPLHPATVHFPLAFLLSASALDLLTHAAQTYPTTITPVSSLFSTSVLSLIQHTTLFSYTLTVAGIITAIPAIASGIQQALGIFSKRGLNAPASKVAILHGALMDASVVAAAWNWWSRRGTEGYMSSQTNGVVSAGIFGVMVVSAGVGGSLVYEHAIGVEKAGQGNKPAGGKKDL